jgi:hypothetical protein
MNRIIGDRKEKSALDEMEEVARARNKEVAEEELLEAIMKAKEEAERAKKPSEPIQDSSSSIITAGYTGIEFEAKAPPIDLEKRICYYDGSLERIKAAGYERHASPSEVFSLLADNLKGKLQDNLAKVAENMLYSTGEWMSMAFEREGDILVCYLHPEGLVWDEHKRIYAKNKFKYACLSRFDISGRKSDKNIPLERFEDKLVKMLYGRSFDDLPEKMREGDKKAGISIPPEGAIYPVARNNYYMYTLSANEIACWASRGVKEKDMLAGMRLLEPGTATQKRMKQ